MPDSDIPHRDIQHSDPIDIAQLIAELELMADLLELKDENPFKINLYRGAARAADAFEGTLEEFVTECEAGRIKGIGKSLAATFREAVTRQQLPGLSELRASLPPELPELFEISGLGPKKIRALYEQLAIDSLRALETACRAGTVAALKGFGAKSQDKILAGIERRKSYRSRLLLSTATNVLEKLASFDPNDSAILVGELRRRMPVISTVELLVFRPAEPLEEVALAALSTVSSSPPPLVVRRGDPDRRALALLFATGPQHFVSWLQQRARERGMELSENGLQGGPTIASEEDLFAALGIPYLEPELRDGFAPGQRIEPLVCLSDIRGILHVHTTYSDGAATLQQMAAATQALGYGYLGITDHSRSAAYAGGLSIDEVYRQHEEIDRLNEVVRPFRIFKGIESDILADGSLDYPDKVLATFDFVIASVHSRFTQSRADMTARIVRAVENPFTTILGHPTGRLLLKREGYELDMEAVLAAAAASRTAIEINADPRRLDLDWSLVRQAREAGIELPVNPDAHSIAGLMNIRWGLHIARKGGARPMDISNCREADDLAQWFRRK